MPDIAGGVPGVAGNGVPGVASTVGVATGAATVACVYLTGIVIAIGSIGVGLAKVILVAYVLPIFSISWLNDFNLASTLYLLSSNLL